MTGNSIPVVEAAACLAAGDKAAAEARRATRWFPAFVVLQAGLALAFTCAVDVFHVSYWTAFALLVLGSGTAWTTALRHRVSAPRHGLRNAGIAVATWWTLYTLMLDPALQLVGATSPWWWVLAGLIAVSPIGACLFASSRR
ncbi:hypothetical protein G3I31_07720 [Streptomyces sp. SID9913]|uniref:hypothetical protein n=1 Tax=unclassified Streptomyces TaxID=2593676 RepID=UPI0013DD38FD|nr:hypothetical protein [Streptomyces sp. SID9913]MBM7088304.1 hypothetical protein [Streptomyces sp. S12]NED18033.1 hypothetical protein [Streptomyces sp. SID9913]